MVNFDSKYRFIWANCGIPRNSYDSTIFQASELYWQITENDIISNIGNIEDEPSLHYLLEIQRFHFGYRY